MMTTEHHAAAVASIKGAEPETTNANALPADERVAKRLAKVERMIAGTGHDPEVVKRGMGAGWQDEIAAMSTTEFMYEAKYVVMRGWEYAEEVARAEARKAKKHVPAGMDECDRCGGRGGAEQWPGFDCFKCEGRGWVESEGE